MVQMTNFQGRNRDKDREKGDAGMGCGEGGVGQIGRLALSQSADTAAV